VGTLKRKWKRPGSGKKRRTIPHVTPSGEPWSTNAAPSLSPSASFWISYFTMMGPLRPAQTS